MSHPNSTGSPVVDNQEPSAPIQLFCAVALKKAMTESVLPSFIRTTGTGVNVVIEPTNVLLQLIEGGARPHVVVGITESLETAASTGIFKLASHRPVAKSGIGLAVPYGVKPPYISTVPALVTALATARSVAYSRSGPSGVYFASLLNALGISELVNNRATIIDKGPTAMALLDGRSDLAIHQVSELMLVPEARIVGPLPAAVQHYTAFSAGLSDGARDNPRALALVNFMCGAPARAAYSAAGME